jgi:hypothetical protein
MVGDTKKRLERLEKQLAKEQEKRGKEDHYEGKTVVMIYEALQDFHELFRIADDMIYAIQDGLLAEHEKIIDEKIYGKET